MKGDWDEVEEKTRKKGTRGGGGWWALGRSRWWGGPEGHDMISNPTRFIFLEVGISGT